MPNNVSVAELKAKAKELRLNIVHQPRSEESRLG